MHVFDLSSEFSLIRVAGANRADFLHRMSTGDLATIAPGEARSTVFTTPIGRMIDHAIVCAFHDHLLMRVSAAGKDKLLRWLRKYVFYNDDVQFADAGADWIWLALLDPGADDWALSIEPDATNLKSGSHRLLESGATLLRTHVAGVAGFVLMGLRGDVERAIATPHSNIEAYEALRIAAGEPRYGSEIAEDYNPLEAGLWGAVSFTKGCYIGQEIFARMESRNQLAKKLVVLEMRGAHSGDRMLVDGVDVGAITSASDSHALGYLRSAVANPATRVNTAGSSGKVVRVVRASWA